MPYARLRSHQMVHVDSPLITSRLLWEGTIVDVSEPGAWVSYIQSLNDRRFQALVDNSELEWLPEPVRPSAWERLARGGLEL